MAGEILLQKYEFYILIFGCVLAVTFGLITFAFIKLTPAKVFFKAWLKKKPIAKVNYRTGIGEFKLGNDCDPGSMDVKDLGFVLLTEGSHIREKRSGAAIFDVFAEYGASIPKEYAPILQELKEKGFNINTFEDYRRLILLATDEEAKKKYVDGLEDSEKDEAKAKIAELKEMKIALKPYKTYRLHELASMFPNNISPVYVDAKVTNAVNRMVKRMKLNNQMWVAVGMGALLIVLAIIIFIKTVKSPSTDVIVKTIEVGVQTTQAVNRSISI